MIAVHSCWFCELLLFFVFILGMRTFLVYMFNKSLRIACHSAQDSRGPAFVQNFYSNFDSQTQDAMNKRKKKQKKKKDAKELHVVR